ncbi:hypothetical protein A2U01_0015278, partial [Trifolium medium]|nr:hypothetical protein [Trifolium medium]
MSQSYFRDDEIDPNWADFHANFNPNEAYESADKVGGEFDGPVVVAFENVVEYFYMYKVIIASTNGNNVFDKTVRTHMQPKADNTSEPGVAHLRMERNIASIPLASIGGKLF